MHCFEERDVHAEVSNWERPVPEGPVYFDAPPDWNDNNWGPGSWGSQGISGISGGRFLEGFLGGSA